MLSRVILAIAGLALVAPTMAFAQASSPHGVVIHGNTVSISGDTYRFTVTRNGFRYGMTRLDGTVIAPAHQTSGMMIDGRPVVASVVRSSSDHSVTFEVHAKDGLKASVRIEGLPRTVKISVDHVSSTPATIDLRTGPVTPAYGLGDYGAIGNGQPDTGTPCGGKVDARRTTELSGVVFDDLTNQGSCKRFISNFTVFPAQSFGQVLFYDGQKRVGLTDSENRLGVAGADGIDSLYYFLGSDLHQVYADYKAARESEGYPEATPRQRMFELGWEAYGALTWNTVQEPVEQTVQAFLDHGYDLNWGVVGSAFWPGPRGNPTEGSTTSFGMWDDTCDYDPADGSRPDMPCPRYPDPDGLKAFFADRGMSLILGLRNNMKAPDQNENWNEHYDGPFAQDALDKGYFIVGDDGKPVTITRAQYPSGPQYVLDGDNPDAVSWFVDNAGKWGANGFKEDAMLYKPDLHHDGTWNPVDMALHNAGYDVIVRNSAYSVPGDVLRVNDTYFGTGADFNHDPDRLPISMLNVAASGAPNVYGDYVGGTPTAGGMTDPAYQDYFVRNAWLLAASPTMAFGRGPWEMDDPAVAGDQGERYAAATKDAADFHERLVPYIYDAALDSHRTGYPSTMTPLPVAFPDDPNTYDLANTTTRQYEWMLGDNILAAPVFGSDFATAQTRDVYLPAGSWIDYATGARFEGPTTLKNYPIGTDRAPVFVGGNGIVVERTDDGLRARVFPVGTAGDRYKFSDGDGSTGVIELANSGWDPSTLEITDTTSGSTLSPEIDGRTGAVEFPFRPGHHYRLAGGGTADDTIARETTAPGAPTGLRHEVDGGIVTLSWDAVDGARSYAVEADRPGQCSVRIIGSTTGRTSLALGAPTDAAGTYRVFAWSSGGVSEPSESHTITASSDGKDAVIVTNEGTPDTCVDDQPAYTEEGSWKNSSLSGVDGSSTRYTSTGTATWRANLDPGRYQVSVWFPSYSNNTDAATYRIADVAEATDGTAAVVTINQRELGGEWVDLGTYTFVQSENLPSVSVTRTGTKYLRADAVRFVPASS